MTKPSENAGNSLINTSTANRPRKKQIHCTDGSRLDLLNTEPNAYIRKTRTMEAPLVRILIRCCLSGRHQATSCWCAVTTTIRKNHKNTTGGQSPSQVYRRNRRQQALTFDPHIGRHHRHPDTRQVGIKWIQDPSQSGIYQSANQRSSKKVSHRTTTPSWDGFFAEQRWLNYKCAQIDGALQKLVPQPMRQHIL